MSDTLPCPCETTPFVPELDIPPGLAALPRQRARFGAFRRSLLAHAHRTDSGALDAWPADDDKDLGLLLIDVWAYLLDILAFYDKEIAQESYLGAAQRTASGQALAELIGYIPKPASAATARIALRAGGADPVTVPKGAAFRSDAFDGEKPQVFEASAETAIHPAHNRWTLAPVEPEDFDELFWLPSGAAIPVVGQRIALRIGTSFHSVATVTAAEKQDGPDGAAYTRLTLDPEPSIPANTPVAMLAAYSFPQSAGRTPFPLATSSLQTTGTYSGTYLSSTPPTAADSDSLVLDAIYPALGEGDPVLVETSGGSFVVAEVDAVSQSWAVVNQAGTATVPLTKVTFSPALTGSATPARLHFGAVRLAALTNPALPRLGPAELSNTLRLLDLLEAFTAERPAPAALAVRGEERRGFESGATIEVDARTGAAGVTLDGASDADPPLKTPVRLFGNLVTTTRGETVASEAIGSGDASLAFQTFKLKKGPLTHLASSAEPSGLAPALDVRVNGVLWSRVPTFLRAGPEDEVYTVRTDVDGKGVIGFGDGVNGKRPPSGANNIVASYRHGAGSAKPPAGRINVVAKAIEGVDGVAFSLAASGGSDAETAADIRRAAPASALTLGRAVSLSDYSAIARAYPGVVNAAAGWAADPVTQRAGVRIWAISDGGSVASDLADHLRGLGDPDVGVTVTDAVAVPTTLAAEITVHDTYLPDEVQAAVAAALSDTDTGMLAPRNLTIGKGIFRSAISAAIQEVDGVEAVQSLALTGPVVPAGLPCQEGEYRDFTQIDVGIIA